MTLPKHLQRMKDQMDGITQRQQNASKGFTKRYDLTGRNSIVASGATVVIRLLPRWDYFQKAFMAKGNQWVPNPKYEPEPIYVDALEHWFTGVDGKRNRVWCPKIFGDGEQCPVCELAEQLKASSVDDDKSLGYDIDAQETFIFNAIQGGFKKRLLTGEGRPDIRPMAVGSGVFMGIGNLMTGQGDEQFARPIDDPAHGYDVMLIRPQEGSGDRWRVTCAKTESPLYDVKDPKEAQAWKGWWNLLIDLEEMIKGELKSYDTVSKLLQGEGGPEDMAEPSAAPETASAEGFDYPEGFDPSGMAPEPGTPGDWGQEFGFPGEEPAPSPPPPTSRPSAGRPMPRRGGRR